MFVSLKRDDSFNDQHDIERTKLSHKLEDLTQRLEWAKDDPYWRESAPNKQKPEPDLKAIEGFNRIIDYSGWAHDGAANWKALPAVPHETGKTERTIMEERLRQALDGAIHDQLAQGRLSAWGRTGTLNVQVEIPHEEWQRIKTDFGERALSAKALGGGPPSASAWSQERNVLARRLAYGDVHFSASQLYAAFPLTKDRR